MPSASHVRMSREVAQLKVENKKTEELCSIKVIMFILAVLTVLGVGPNLSLYVPYLSAIWVMRFDDDIETQQSK